MAVQSSGRPAVIQIISDSPNPATLSLEIPVGVAVKLTRRKTNISKTIQLTVNADQKVFLDGKEI
jgi:hypothetical protein